MRVQILLILILCNGLYFTCGKKIRAEVISHLKEEVQKGIESLTFDLMNKILFDDIKKGVQKNVVFSPLGIYVAMSVALFGANTPKDREELINRLGYSEYKNELNEMHTTLSAVVKFVQDLENLHFNTTQVVLLDRIFCVDGNFMNAIKPFYDDNTHIAHLNWGYYNDTRIVQQINSIKNWFITDIPDEEKPATFTAKAILGNIVTFDGKWDQPFSAAYNQEYPFQTDRGTVDVMYMRKVGNVLFERNYERHYEVIGIPYESYDAFLMLILPYHNQGIYNLTKTLSQQDFHNMIHINKYVEVDYSIPKVNLEYAKDLVELLQKLDMLKMFDKKQGAFLNRHVERFMHEIKFSILENGTMDDNGRNSNNISFLKPAIPFAANRPFLFFIYHENTAVILLSGIVYNPMEN